MPNHMLKRKYTRTWTERERKIGLHLKKSLRQRFQKAFSEPKQELKKLSRKALSSLTSHNSFARRLWYKTLGYHLCKRLGATAPNFVPKKSIFMLTIFDSNMMVNPDIDPDDNPTLPQIRSKYSDYLKGLDYLGMIDVAHYVSLQRTHGVSRLYAYHCHVLVWNSNKLIMKKRRDFINQNMMKFISHTTPAFFREVEPDALLQVLWYCTKTPRSQYQVHQRASKRWKQYKRPINGVNSVRLYAEMGQRTLEELTLADGQGTDVLNRTRRDVERVVARKAKLL